MQTKLDYIDALRGFAILLVMMVHVSQFGNMDITQATDSFLHFGQRGVQLFYIASAFTLFYSFNYRRKEEKHPNRNFFIRRFFRIAPLYYLAIVLYLYLLGFGDRYWLGDADSITVYNILANFSFLHGFYPYWINSLVPGAWSIAVEMTFYACLPMMFYFIKNLKHALWFLILSLIVAKFLNDFFEGHCLISDQALWIEYLYFYFPSQVPVFALGFILFFKASQQESWQKAHLYPGAALLGLALFSAVFPEHGFFPKHIQISLIFLLLAYLLSRFPLKILVNSITQKIGQLSYGLYLIHFAVLFLFEKFQLLNLIGSGIMNYVLRYFMVLAVAICLANLLQRYIELPAQNWGKKWIQKLGL